MKAQLSLLLVPFLAVMTGCSTRVSSHHDYNYGHRSHHHNHVSVGVSSGRSGAAVVGALIVGGIIGSIINESEHRDAHQPESSDLLEDENINKQASGSQDELVNGYPIDNGSQNESDNHDSTQTSTNEYDSIRSEQASQVEWYQLGKDKRCYLMGVSNGVTDVISEVPVSQCKN